jgi:hypothetical protein
MGSSQLRGGIRRFLESMLMAAVVLVALVASALGQTASQPATQDSTAAPAQAPIQRTHAARKPFRAARLTYLAGSVVVEQASSKTQDAAVVNMPLVEGTVLSTGEDGEAEIEFEDGSLVRVTPNSGVSLLNLSVNAGGDYQTRVAVLGGLVYAELRAGTKYQYTLDAGGTVVTPAENSTVRVNLDEPPPAIAVLQGSVHVGPANSTAPSTATIHAQGGQTARADVGQSGVFTLKDEIAPESWDQWSEDRDQVAAGEAGAQTVARDQFAGDQGYGWSDLDANGSWYNLPGQGQVWQPDIAEDSGEADASVSQDAGSGFDPYGYGSWVWTPAGYSWASSYGWGWLPYRCGQWVYFDGFGWGWEPGLNCGAFGFGGYGFGGYGFGVNIGRAPGFWRRPKRPIPGPGPVHPIVRGRVGPVPVGGPRYGSARVIRVKTIDGQSVEPLPPVASISARSGNAIGSALRRDYPVNTSNHEPALGVISTHNAPETGRAPWQPAGGVPAARSHMVPMSPSGSREAPRPAPVVRSAPAPAQHSSPPPPAASHSAPSSSPHK